MKIIMNRLLSCLFIAFLLFQLTGCAGRFKIYSPPSEGSTAIITLDSKLNSKEGIEKIFVLDHMDFYFFNEEFGCPLHERGKSYDGAVTISQKNKTGTINIPAGKPIYIKGMYTEQVGSIWNSCEVAARFVPEAEKHYIFSYRKRTRSCSAALYEVSENKDLLSVPNSTTGHIEDICPPTIKNEQL